MADDGELYPGIQSERVRPLDDQRDDDALDGRYVLYWMQASVRTELNHALEYAVRRANELGRPLLVVFGLMEDYPEATRRHYTFLLQGLADVEKALAGRSIPFVVRRGSPDDVALDLAGDAALLVTDLGYLRHQRRWRERVAREAPCPVVQVESEVVVPVELVSDKAETAARTIRPKINRHLDRFLVPLPTARLQDTTRPRVDGEDLSSPDALLDRMGVDDAVPAVPLFTGGSTAATKVLEAFLRERFDRYAEHRMRPETDDVSHLSKYLHFGHISPVAVALAAREARSSGEDVESFLEELIVRRELPMNFVWYTPRYDTYGALPQWARDTLAEHADDERQHVYTRRQLEEGRTHDEYWNAAMAEMRHTGYLHNYMRMYWGKKILEWSKTPETAFRTTLHLNNTYFLDGRDPASYANVAWIFGTHDRGWTEREVFGKVRYMAASGLERKADPAAYVDKVHRLVEQVEAARDGR